MNEPESRRSAKLIVAITVLGILVAGYFVVRQFMEGTTLPTASTNIVQQQAANDEPIANEGTMMAGEYVTYTPEALATSKQDTNVLFFHAQWCVTCRGLDRNITTGTVPAGMRIIKVDYDSSTALRQKYEVTTQHTLVQVDKNGNLLKKWGLSRDLADIQAEVI
jgi:thiol:disulfide interchange protein